MVGFPQLGRAGYESEKRRDERVLEETHMLNTGWRAALFAVLLSAVLVGGCGSGTPFTADIAAIAFETTSIPSGGAGQLYNVLIRFTTEGNAPLPDRFEIESGVLPQGVTLIRDRVDANFDGIPDTNGAYTGNARLLGFPRETGSFTFVMKAIATGALGATSSTAATNSPGQLPALAAEQQFNVNIGEGSISILTPTAAEGTQDPQVPAVSDVYDFVNPADPQGFTGVRFQVAGGSGSNEVNIYMPRELELSVFDDAVANLLVGLDHDTDESPSTGDKFQVAFADGGWFQIQSGTDAQVGGFQSPRGPVGTIANHGPIGGPYTPGLDPAWFQKAPGAGGPARNSRRNLGDTDGLSTGDNLVIPGRTILFSDYFDAAYEGTHDGYTDPDPVNPPVLTRRKYPFTSDQYANAFFLAFNPAIDLTPLRYYVIVEAIDKRNTASKTDDVINRKAYVFQIRIPDIVIDSVFLSGGQAGVDYTQFVNASGGVPPLSFDLEWVDGVPDAAATVAALDKSAFGIDLNPTTGQFFGVPRATGVADLTVRVFAAVMNPVQNGAAFVPTGTVGEFNGTHPLTGKAGIHKTFPVTFSAPTLPTLSNVNLPAGVDGTSYPGAQLIGAGGVENLIPNPVGFGDGYPTGTALRTYEWSSTFILDTSHGGLAGTSAAGMPNALVLDGNANSLSNGQISGITYDRGFIPITFTQLDFFLGTTTSPNLAASRLSSQKTLGLSVSPDTAIYLRGVKTSEDANGEPTGLLDASAQIAEPRNTPMFLAAGFFTVDTGKTPVRNADLPVQFDILPVGLANGGSDEFVDKSIPSVSGFWPAEASKEAMFYNSTSAAWQHLQQEVTWIQLPNHFRMYLFGETQIKKFNSGATSGGWSKKYQIHSTSSGAKRGIIMLNPITGDYWMPAILSAGLDHGTQFGAEAVLQRDDGGYYYYEGVGYWKRYYYGQTDSRWDRELLTQGLGNYIEQASSNTSQGWYRVPQGRSGVSIAVSDDGKWAATALPSTFGGEQKILLWKTDKTAIPSSIYTKSFATRLDGKAAGGSTLTDSAVILNLGGENFGTVTTASDQRHIFPDSLCFVQDGLIWMDQVSTASPRLDVIFGISLIDGTLSNRVVSGGAAPISSSSAMYVPDQDYLRGEMAQAYFSVQHAWARPKAAPGETGANRFAFVAGSNGISAMFSDDTASPRDGWRMKGNRAKSLYVMKLAKDGSTGLRLSGGSNTLSDLTGADNRIYGDLLTPGRPGEDQDYLTMSPDGKYVAVVRDVSLTDYQYYTFYPDWTAYQTFAVISTGSGGQSWDSSNDLLICSVDGEDLDAASGTQTVLYVGTGGFGSGNPSMPSYASGAAHINGTYRRINGVTFGSSTAANEERSVIFKYSSDTTYTPLFSGYTSGWGINPQSTGTFGFGVEMSVRVQFKSTSGGALTFASTSNVKNNLQGLAGVGSVGPTSAPFGNLNNATVQCFWTTFKSPNGNFLYYVSDQLTGAAVMVGFNISNAAIGSGATLRNPYVAYLVHATTTGLDQIEVNSFTYANRFYAVPGGVTYPPSGRSGDGLVFFIASDPSASSLSNTDLDVYVFDSNVGGVARVLTSGVTDTTANAINHLYVSADGNFLVGQRTRTTSLSRDSRATLTTNSDLFAVTNVHAVLAGSAPTAIRLVSGQSLGSSVAFVGEGTSTGPQAVIFSSAPTGATTTWRDRTLKIVVMATGAVPEVLDSTASHYVVLSGGRTLHDNPLTAN